MDRFFGRVLQKRATIESDFKHLKVKRIKEGDLIEVIDERSLKPFLGKVIKITKKRAEVEVLQELPLNVPKVFIRLYQCVPVKLSTFDEIVEMVSQVGVSEIVPVISKRSFNKVSTLREKLERWNRIALESVKQCGRHRPLKVLPPLKLEEIEPLKEGLNLFPFERESSKLLAEELLLNKTAKVVALVIGPEGGFAKEEADLLEEKGFKPVSLGNFILKAQTAAVVSSFTVYHLLLQNEA